ncbi:intermediate filament protein ifa-4-like [Ruditapes philippinarum]|uniref:intermediate filament protein ifa-4-like n=1 Tax=Ruditapes philippinarum TaxID=129788 RepID=UPI00295BC38D|nr:intermediate filament protein ifa-4-like [Ruditapes philippinarum]
MYLRIIVSLLVIVPYGVGRHVKREDSLYWSSIYVESSSQGPFVIAGIQPEGEFIILENISDEREYLNGWKIQQKIDGRLREPYMFEFCSIAPHHKRKIVANKWSENATATDFVATDVYTWGTGSEVKTYLYDKDDDLKASHIVGTATS